ncbi:RagB/SusD family nutrient uptake outer membrane protein [Hymenobacter sediminicola]|uniref:RagB/SusD family nutrient uptake outer membrane protein n=1 Tax=Hymenobacter sediminicola TaxID=2761579 RepID=A0A7G7WAY9_9BACT|nr:RagB/SusD family nutrient uptake outer membrane protein [Hymenobacter sediminicola]QNH63532.1 RagB/SusD family nutrient uptake outer membrane protein [Hymenobacter sediminicola]
MKKTFLSLLAASVLVLSACEKDLDQAPISSGSVPTFYKTADDFTQAINSVYSNLRDYPDRQLTMSETRSDNIYGVSTQGIRTWEPINNFSTTITSNEYPADTWTTDFVGVFRANIVLDQLTKNGSVLTDADRTRIEGEAKFLRALYYFDLVRYFGKVPLVDRPLEPQEVVKIPRTPVAEVYNLIVADLQDAITKLPDTYAAANLGRATNNAAKSMLALVYLTRSGPTYGIEGPGLGTSDYDAAIALLDQVINSGKYQLITTAGTSPSAYANVFSYTNENNREVIFDVQYISGGTGLGASYPSILLTNNYFQSIGAGTGFGTGDELRPPSNDLVAKYATADTRKAATLQVGYTTTTTPVAVETRPAFKKYVNGALRGTSRTDWPINFIVMRYADVLLLKAEALLRKSGPSTVVDGLVKQVRDRAGLTANPLTGVTMAQLMEERRLEFACEGLRWHDLVRSGQLVTIMNSWATAEDTRNRIRKPIVANDILYPVPQNELAASSYLYEQNPGY